MKRKADGAARGYPEEIASSCLSVVFDGRRVRLRIVGNFNTDFGVNDWAEIYEGRSNYGPAESVRRARSLRKALIGFVRDLDCGNAVVKAAKGLRR